MCVGELWGLDSGFCVKGSVFRACSFLVGLLQCVRCRLVGLLHEVSFRFSKRC